MPLSITTIRSFHATTPYEVQLVHYDINSREITPLTNDENVHSQYATWSPDGMNIIYSHFDTQRFTQELMRIDNATGESHSLGAARAYHSRVSPDGSQIAYMATNEEGYGGLYLMDADATNICQLLPHEPHNYFMEWLP